MSEKVLGRRVMCYPVQHAHPPLRVAGVEHRIEGETVTLHFKSETHKLNLEHFKKLVTKHNNEEFGTRR